MARKNFLFSGSGTGARSTCFMFTLIETAKANNKNPDLYANIVATSLDDNYIGIEGS